MSGFLGSAWQFAFQVCPIFLTGGIANFIPGSVLPIVVLTEAINLPLGLISGNSDVSSLDNFFAQFIPQAGATLADNDISRYPFANQTIAANALIQKPLHISMRMICPVRQPLGYASKFATMMLLKAALDQHDRTAGTYTVLTPSFPYTNCIRTRMTDVTGGGTHQAQAEWQLDFEAPLLTLQAAQAAQNSLMSKLSNGTQIDGNPSWSDASSATGQTSPLTPVPAGAQATGSSVVTAQNLSPVAGVPLSPSGFNTIQPTTPSGFPASGG
jgi:hypothetical protein